MSRGGPAARFARAARQQQASGYRLTGVPAGSPVAECLDPYRRWHLGHRVGVIVRNSIAQVTVQWEGEEGFTSYPSAEARYKVDTNLWRIGESRGKSPLTALTSGGKGDRVTALPHPGAEDQRGGSAMADVTKYTVDQIKGMTIPQLKKIAEEHYDSDDIKGLRKTALQDLILGNEDLIESEIKGAIEVEDDELDDDEIEDDTEVDDTEDEADDEELDDLEEDEVDEVDEPAPAPKKKASAKPKTTEKSTPPEPNGDTLTAKQVATRIGTDAKTLRKFFRSDKSTVEAVGQGGRYEFAKSDLEKIKSEFESWNTSRPTRTPKSDKPKETQPKRKGPETDIDEAELELEDEIDDELEDDDLELDDDELDD